MPAPSPIIAEAKQLGQTWYFTGVPCKNGHVARRWIQNHYCHECIKERNRRLRRENPAPWRAKEKRRRDRDPAAYRELQRKRRLRHIEKRRAYDRQRYCTPERQAWQKKQAVEWARQNKGKRNRIVAARRWWIKRATPPWLTAEQKAEIAAIYLEASRRGESVDHIYPLRAKNSCGLHVPWNLQIMPLLDNIRKNNKVEDGAE